MTCGFVLFALWTFGSSVALAQDAALMQAARKEGKVVWYTSLALPPRRPSLIIFRTNIKASRWRCTAAAPSEYYRE
jgi:hypothetical protein